MKRLHFILIFFIILLAPNVYAADVDVTSNCYGTTGYSSMYNGHEVVYQTDSLYSFGTTYEGQLSTLETELRYSLTANTEYTISFLTNNTDDFRNTFFTWSVYDVNHNNTDLVTGFSFVSMRKVSVSFKTTSATNKVKIHIGSRNNYESITGINNWNIKKVVLSSVSSSATQQDVINNQNQNTQDIINNNNTNTQDIINNDNTNTQNIIDNQNDNTQDIIDNANENITCPVGPLYLEYDTFKDSSLDGKYLTSDGSLGSASSYSVSVYFKIKPNQEYKLDSFINLNDRYFCFYTQQKSVISCSPVRNGSVVSPSNASYLRFSLRKDRVFYIKGPICNDWEKEGLNEIKDYLQDDSNPNIQDNDFLSMFNSVGVTDPLSYLLTLPTQLINKIVSLSNTCSSINLGTLYGVMISLPCINLENILGSSVWNIIDVIFSVSLLVVILKNLYDTFSNLLTMGAEKEAKEKFSMPTPMDFLSMILGGDR